MEHARLSSLLVIALLSLSQTELSSTLPETWYAANVISDGDNSPKPLAELFATEATFSSTNPIVVLPTSTTPNPVISTSTLPNVPFPSSTLSTTLGTITEGPTVEVTELLLSTVRPVQTEPVITVPTQPPPIPTVFFNTTAATQSPPFAQQPQPPQPPQPAQPPQPPILFQFQQPSAPPPPPPFVSTPQGIEIQTAQQTLPPQQFQNFPPNIFLLNQQLPQMQNRPLQTLPFTLPPTTTTTLPPSTTPTPLPLSSVTTQAPCANATPPANQFPTFRIRMVAPSGSITNVRFNANPATTTTRRPTTTRTRRRNRNNYDGCVNGCGGTRESICASPLAVTPIDPDTLKGFPSVCHMACHNSFRRTLYQKVADGKCSRFRTRIRPINENKLKRDDLNKATYTIVQGGPTIVEFSPLNS